MLCLGIEPRATRLEAQTDPLSYGCSHWGNFKLHLFNLLFEASVTRLGDLLHFGQLFKAGGNNYFAQIANTFLAIFVNVSKSFIFLVK